VNGTYTPEEVFVTDGFPKHTYVRIEDGRKEDEVQDGLGQKNKIISISGPSKSGKTTLCDKVFGTRKGIDKLHINGSAVGKAQDAWVEAYRQISDDTSVNYFELSYAEMLESLIESGLPFVIDDFHYISRDVQVDLCRQLKNAASDGLRIICLSVRTGETTQFEAIRTSLGGSSLSLSDIGKLRTW
jgi:hypothetical protein